MRSGRFWGAGPGGRSVASVIESNDRCYHAHEPGRHVNRAFKSPMRLLRNRDFDRTLAMPFDVPRNDCWGTR